LSTFDKTKELAAQIPAWSRWLGAYLSFLSQSAFFFWGANTVTG
jgi:hypothetical protein